MKYFLPYLFLLLLPLTLASQDSLPLTKNFRFADGVFLSFNEFRTNAPAHLSDEVELRFFTNPQTFLTQMEAIVLKKTGRHLPLDSVWAISLDGIPYVQVPSGEINREMPTFAALKLRGKICYFAYPDYRMKKVPVSAYNPVTGRPFRTGIVEREHEVFVEKMLHFETGEILDFNVPNFLAWIADDAELTSTVHSLDAREAKEKLFKCLLIYVDRNVVFLKKSG